MFIVMKKIKYVIQFPVVFTEPFFIIITAINVRIHSNPYVYANERCIQCAAK